MPQGASGASIGALLALLAATFWGGADFSGGMGAKATGGTVRGALRLLISAHLSSLAAISLLLLLRHRVALHGWPVVWGITCGVVEGLSLVAFYVALARGEMGASAALSGLLAAIIPAGVGVLIAGRPSIPRLVGFGLAGAAIWLVAGTGWRPAGSHTWLAIAGGLGFGCFFTGLKFANPLGVLEPLALARTGSLITCCLFLCLLTRRDRAKERGPWLTRSGWFWAGTTALLDSGGNLLYIAATRAGRLDVAAVLASLYPASTILLAAAVLKEKPGRRQLAGMGVALVAVVLVML